MYSKESVQRVKQSLVVFISLIQKTWVASPLLARYATISVLSILITYATLSAKKPESGTIENGQNRSAAETDDSQTLTQKKNSLNSTQPATVSQPAPQQTPPEDSITILPLKSGERLIDHLKSRGITTASIYEMIAALKNKVNLNRLQQGTEIGLVYEHNNPLAKEMTLRTAFDTYMSINLRRKPLVAEQHSTPITSVLVRKSGVINDSLIASTQTNNIPIDAVYKVTNIYSYDVDFQRDIRPGTRYEILYEILSVPLYGDSKTGAIKMATLHLHNRSIPVYEYKTISGDVNHFHATGESVQKALLKTPVDGARISSRYGKRKHPILGYYKTHKGIDFGARRGTPIKASGDGIIDRANRYGSYGNYIKIKHKNGYSTAYAHLHRFAKGLKKGKRVKQGDVIGYVGTTGRSTGPHLHYEVLKNNRHVNPARLKFPARTKLSKKDMDKFHAFIEENYMSVPDVADSTQKNHAPE
ncbi:M23 family metallopeptidase [Temperatibacter marinus]|uniref:M23 family metallopeptidase n=1 Tax=Temperatibacter marinus TaxID=1456591 RepID=A0AA52H825_9PROT|nr:M23 family metallopeptidase [Temperatibacter marinus]WND01389.1 M23 family metallopeptidase [Temperatibacter marinus]